MAAYGSDEGLAEWLLEQGYTLPEDSPASAILRARGSSYLDSVYESIWTGQRTGGVAQELGWPRTGAMVRCLYPIDPDAIPVQVVNASYRAAWLEGSSPGSLEASAIAGRSVSKEKVDVIEISYHSDDKVGVGLGGLASIDSGIDGSMSLFACLDSGGFFLKSIGS